MLATVMGGARKKKVKTMRIGRKRRSTQCGGAAAPWSPAELDVQGGMGTDVNFNAGAFPQQVASKMVGGSYGFTGGETTPFGGNYAPYKVDGGSEGGDLTRGGNNILSGGRRSRRGRKHSGHKHSGRKHRQHKFTMKGCMGTKRKTKKSPAASPFFKKFW
jgi:hypothetical protein